MSRRRGFTLVELMVVLVIIAVLVGLLLPAVWKVREAAARARCQSHLKQLALSLHNYADSHPLAGDQPGPAFPAGTIAHHSLPPAERLSWMVAVLPYLEQDTMAKRFDQTAGATANNAAVGMVQQFHCSSVPAGQTGTQYVGIAGSGPEAAGLPLHDKRAGVFGFNRRSRLADITDGTSNTLLVLETARDTGDWHRGGSATARGIDPADPVPLGRGQAFGGLHTDGRGGWWRRPSGGNAAMADGSVRWVRDDTSATTLSAWATAAGGEAVADLD